MNYWFMGFSQLFAVSEHLDFVVEQGILARRMGAYR